jgi:hypothetical protein
MTLHLLIATLAVVTLAPHVLAQALPTPSARSPTALASQVIRVPEGGPTPVLLDGQLSVGEWSDARDVPIGGPVRLLLKQSRGHVLIAVATGTRMPRPVDIFLEDAAGRVHQLHASAQIGERALADTLWGDWENPAWRWGNHVDWIANEAKLDSEQPTTHPFSARAFPADATEFQIRRSRFPGGRWRIRVDVGLFPGNKGVYTFPRGPGRAASGWAVLALDA